MQTANNIMVHTHPIKVQIVVGSSESPLQAIKINEITNNPIVSLITENNFFMISGDFLLFLVLNAVVGTGNWGFIHSVVIILGIFVNNIAAKIGIIFVISK